MFNFKKSLLFVSILLILCISLGAVSAANIDVNDIESDDSIQGISIDSTIAVDGNENGNGGDSAISNLKGDENTFSALNATINSGKTEITLENDYAFDETTDGDFVKGIVIDKTMTIDGQGHTISGSNLARIFNITKEASNVKILNLNFENGYILGTDAYTGSGGAIFSYGSNLIIDNCNFTNNKAPGLTQSEPDGFCGAIYVSGSYSQLLNSNFINNSARSSGAVRIAATGVIIDGCSFINNIAKANEAGGTSIYGGALYISTKNTQIKNSLFENNSASTYGGAISYYSKGSNGLVVDNCTFRNNYAGSGGAIHLNQVSDILISNSLFVNNNATKGASIFLPGGNKNNTTITKCVFLNNTATSQGSAVVIESYNDISVNYCIFEGNSKYNGVLVVKSLNSTATQSFDYNFWGINKTGNVSSFIYHVSGDVSGIPNNFVVVAIDDENVFNSTTKKVSFVCNDSSELTGVLPNYDVSLSNTLSGNIISPTVVTISNNEGEFDYNVANYGVETIVAKSIFDDTVLDTTSFKVMKGTFTDLQTLIDEAEGELNLPINFYYDSAIDSSNLKDGVVINKPITINGNGHTIDGKNLARIFNITADNVIIKNLTLINGKVTNDNGGAIYWSGANGKITDSTLKNNGAYGNTALGGAIFVNGANFEVDKCTFIDNVAATGYVNNDERYGGGSIFIEAPDCTVSNSKFSNPGIPTKTQIRNGGAILVNDSNAKIIGCTFKDLNAGFSAGGVCTRFGAEEFEIRDCTFTNVTGNNGGALVVKANSVIDNCTFDNCGGYLGNAILAGKASQGMAKDGSISSSPGKDIDSLVINDCKFIKCYTIDNGNRIGNGAVDIHREVKNAVISGNTVFEDCTVDSPYSYYEGGAGLYNECNNLTIEGNCTFNNCSVLTGASQTAGAIYNYGSINVTGNLNVYNCKVGSAGGAVYAAYDNDKNFGELGVYHFPGEFIISGTANFVNNTANDGEGGVIYSNAGSNVIIEGTANFVNNTANKGGAICSNGNLSVDGAKFIENAAEEGSVIYSTGNLTICNVEVVPVEDDDKAPIYNLGNITSKTIITVLDNSSYPFYGKICLNATITTNGIPVAKENLRFIINGQEILALATDDGLYTADYNGYITEDQIVSASYDGATDVEVKTGILLKRFYTFTDLQTLINEAGDELNLPNDFYYDPNVDAALKNGVEIKKPITINGNGYTIDGKNLARMFVVKAEDVEIDNINFINGNTGGNGGAIDVYNSTTISGCNFTNNFATSNGGAINFQEGSNSTVENCIFTANRANAVSGGAIYTPSVELNIIDSIFKDNYAQSSGSAIQSWKSIYIDGCSFDSNEANGGATLMFDYETDTSCYVVVKNSNFTNNKATSVGAVQIINSESSDNLIENCLFANNSATSANVGALYISATGAKVINSTFYNNTAITNGGAASLKGDIAVENCNFTLNNAAEAGAIRARNGVNITNCMFDSNKAGAGGALMTEGSVIVKESNFIDNTANNGSAIYNKGNLNITDSSATNIDGDNKAPIYNIGTITSKTVITVLDNSSYALVDGKALLNATITTSDIPVTGGDLVFSINGETVTATETETGLYEVEYTNSITKNQVVTASYDGANDVEVKNGNIIVNPKYVVIVLAEDTEFVASAGKKYVIGITSDDVGIVGYKVILELVNGDIRKNYTLTTDDNGQVALAINLAYARNYTFNIYFEAQEDYLSNSDSQNISVIPLNTSLTTISSMDVMIGSDVQWIANLTDSNNDAIINTYVDVHFKKVGSDDERIYKLKSDNEGKIKLPLNLRYIGEYSVYAEFKGNSKYSSSKSNETTINIIASKSARLVTNYKGNILVTTNNSCDYFKVQLLDASADEGIKGAKLHINFTNSEGIGPVYNVTTDSNGFAYLKLNLSYAGDYKADVFFDGDNTYRPIEKGSCITTIKVEKE